MKKFLIILLLTFFLCGCSITIDTPIQQTLWDKVEFGNKYTFILKHNYTNEKKYYRIERLTEEEYKKGK